MWEADDERDHRRCVDDWQGGTMTLPTIAELDRIRAQAIERKLDELAAGPRGWSFGNAGVTAANHAGVAAVRDAVIEGLAREAEALDAEIWTIDGNGKYESPGGFAESLADWLRSHLADHAPASTQDAP